MCDQDIISEVNDDIYSLQWSGLSIEYVWNLFGVLEYKLYKLCLLL